MNHDQDKGWVIGLLAGAILAIFLLAISLTGLEMNPGLLVDLSVQPQTSVGVGGSAGWGGLVTFMRILLGLILVMFPIYIIYMLLDPQRRKQLLRNLIFFALMLFLFDRLSRLSQNLTPNGTAQSGNFSAAEVDAATAATALNDFVNQPPNWLVITVILSVVALVALAIFPVLWFTLRRRPHDDDAVTVVAQQDEEALRALENGSDLRSTILQCYRSMVAAVKNERGIQRESSVTPREFVAVLSAKGLPPEPVRALTRIFEDVRYGNQPAGPRQQVEAVGCLEEIVAACRRTREAA
jgi:hypothetical protein